MSQEQPLLKAPMNYEGPLELADCPLCNARGRIEGIRCGYCQGNGRIIQPRQQNPNGNAINNGRD